MANRLSSSASRRRTITESLSSVALLPTVRLPGLDQCYRAVDAVSEAKDATEAHLYSQLRNLTNLDLRLVCYDITSSYFETVAVGCGRYVITTSLDKDEVPAAQVVRYYRSLQSVEHRFRVLKDFLELRPIFHWTEGRVRCHVALCVLATPSRPSWPRTS